jgi:hypothetical protein
MMEFIITVGILTLANLILIAYILAHIFHIFLL